MSFDPWNIFFLVCFVVYVAIRGIFDRRARQVERVVRNFDALERMLLVLVGIGSLLLPVIYIFTPFLQFADYELPAFVPWLGAPVMLAGLWIFYRSHADLGSNWSVTLELRKGHELVTNGVYGWVRHPMYAAILLFDIGQGMILKNWLAGWAALATFLLLYIVRTPREEQMMSQFFGEAYENYKLRTGQLFPRFRR